MGDSDTLKLTIHFGGIVNKEEEDYYYRGELGVESVTWKITEITWEKFLNFSIHQAKIIAPIRIIWYKEAGKEMKTVDYACEGYGEDMFLLCFVGKRTGELDIFLEHDCSELSEHGNIIYLPASENEIVGNKKKREDEEYSEDNDEEVDRPKEDEEPEQSEDERHESDNENVASRDEHMVDENVAGAVDELLVDENVTGARDKSQVEENVAGVGDKPRVEENVAGAGDKPHVEENVAGAGVEPLADKGDEVVLDVGDGGNDVRFTDLFDEGSKAKPDKGAYQNFEEQEAAEREAEESEEECVIEEDAEYPDTPLESDEEWEQLNNEKGLKGKMKDKRKSKFHGDLEKKPYIWLFQKFNSGLEFKDQLLRYSLKTQYDVKMAKSEANRIAVICCDENCKFKVFCSYEAPINKWMVKVCHMNHNHGKSSRVSMLKQGVIAGLFREEIRRNICLQAAEIKDTIKARYNIVVPISKCYRGRRIALNTILEAQTTQFGKLWDYEAELQRTHKGIKTDLITVIKNGVEMFDCFYICFEEFRNTWKSCCRPVIGLDGCFLKWELNGDLLAAVGRDADNRMYPIAWAVVKGENKDTWGWFVKKLKTDLELRNGDNLTIISDKQKGLVIAIEAELPHAEHRMCARHIYANWKKQGFTRSEYKNLFWGVAYSYTEGEYEEKMQLVQSYDPAAYHALLETEPHRWCRAFFSVESHCADVHNNLSESFNRTIKMARSKPVINMLEDIRRQAMRRVSRRFQKANNLETIVTPITMALLEKARVESKYCSTIRSSRSLYEVIEFDSGYTVNLSTHQCACRRWDLTGIPCKHAVCVLDDNKDDPVRYVADYYYSQVLKKTYEDNIKPVNGEKLWRRTNKPPIAIPEFRKPRGRPKTRERKKEPFESLENAGKSTRHGRIPHCSRCKQPGHNKSGCKNDPVVVEGPKNRRGRPFKNPNEIYPKPPPKPRDKKKAKTIDCSSQPLPSNATSASEVHPKPPPKPRGRKKTPAAESSSQPLPSNATNVAEVDPKPLLKPKGRKKTQTTESSSHPLPSNATGEAELSSSAPQPSALASQAKQHVKKTSKGRPLKIRKTDTIPLGIGTFWSPFTDRPFEVFGNRVYDRSGHNPQPPEDINRQPQE